MVLLTIGKPHTVHARSIDRTGPNDTPGSYRVALRDAIKCADRNYIRCTLVSAKIPSTFYQMTGDDTVFTVRFNQPTHSIFHHYIDLAIASVDQLPNKARRAEFARSVTVTIKKGNYTIESLLAEIKTKLNAALTAAHVVEKFRTFLRSVTPSDSVFAEDVADLGLLLAKPHIEMAPQFEWYFDTELNRMQLFRTDAAGKMVLGKFDLRTQGVKLGMALGLPHITAQQVRDYNLPAETKTVTATSVHYREGFTTYYEFPVLTPATAATFATGDKRLNNYGHTLNSAACCNLYANDSVYFRLTNLPTNSYETLYGGLTNVMAVIPMYSAAATENFHNPQHPTTTNIGAMGVSELVVRLTDAMGVTLDFNSVENEFQLLFECFEDKTRPQHLSATQTSFAGHHSNVPGRYATRRVVNGS